MVCRGVACDECLKKCKRYHKKPGEFLPVDARFFKVMIGEDYSKVMYLPPAFAKTVKDLTDKRTQIMDVQGDRWSVTVSCVDGLLAFQEGWQEFSQCHNLKEGDFLLFSYTKGKGSRFTANIFGRSGCERRNFSNEMPRPSKKSRTDHGTTVEDEPYKADDVHSGDKPISPTSVVSKNESQRLETNTGVENVDVEVSNLQMPVNFEDMMCLIDWDNRRYEEKQKDLLYDMSSFEMENRASGVEKIQEPLMLGPPQTEINQHDADLEVASDSKTPVSCIGIVKLMKPEGDDAVEQTKSTGVQTDIVTGNSGEKFEKAVDVKRPSSHTKITEQIRKKVDDAQKAPPSSQTGCHAVKKEPVEMEDRDIIFSRISCGGKEPPVVISPRVKIEPDLSPETNPLDAIASTFSSVVENRFYLELSENIARAPGKKYRTIEGMFVYLRDSVGRLWPVLYQEYFSGRAFTVNWTAFCQKNNVMPGDKCRFVAEDVKHWIYRVVVARGC